MDNFVLINSNVNVRDDPERTWFLDPRETDGSGSSRGLVQYGTFGFESNIKDSKTKKINYGRLLTDVEEVPLYYEI